ncbi:MAG: PepSY domain-containing protein [Lachnospiraceae bacterium]|nr:PepSY domain-containing protein [Lachnospiraceae bacterium]
MFKRAFALFTAGVMMAGVFAAAGSMGAMAAENTSEAAAKEIALKDAGVAEKDATFDRIKTGTEQGVSVYEIEFRTKEAEYDYDIALADGEIVKESRELIFPSVSGNQISEAEAKQIATKDAGVEEKAVKFTKFGSDTEDGIPAYEMEFENETEEFDYDIAKAGGKILKVSRTVKIPASAAQKQAKAAPGTGKKGSEAAIAAALDHAGFTSDEVYGLRCEKDYDDGREIYEVEFKKDGYEYNYDIDANNYSVLEWDQDYDD